MLYVRAGAVRIVALLAQTGAAHLLRARSSICSPSGTDGTDRQFTAVASRLGSRTALPKPSPRFPATRRLDPGLRWDPGPAALLSRSPRTTGGAWLIEHTGAGLPLPPPRWSAVVGCRRGDRTVDRYRRRTPATARGDAGFWSGYIGFPAYPRPAAATVCLGGWGDLRILIAGRSVEYLSVDGSPCPAWVSDCLAAAGQVHLPDPPQVSGRRPNAGPHLAARQILSEAIRAGEVYQACVCTRFTRTDRRLPSAFYRLLANHDSRQICFSAG